MAMSKKDGYHGIMGPTSPDNHGWGRTLFCGFLNRVIRDGKKAGFRIGESSSCQARTE